MKRSKTLFVISILAPSAGVLLSSFAMAGPPRGTSTDAAASTPPDVKEYRRWACANPKPALIPNRLAALCAAPLPAVIAREQRTNPHDPWYIRVFVNEKGRKAFFHSPQPKYPVGTVIVKEKLRTPNTTTRPELLTVMVKRAPGFDSPRGDWEYLVYDGAGHINVNVTPQTRSGVTACRDCHTSQRNADYVFRSYIAHRAYRRSK